LQNKSHTQTGAKGMKETILLTYSRYANVSWFLKTNRTKIMYIVTYSGSINDGTLMHSKTQYTTLDYSSQLFYNSNTRITSASSLI
jgi:hypothetical protein